MQRSAVHDKPVSLTLNALAPYIVFASACVCVYTHLSRADADKSSSLYRLVCECPCTYVCVYMCVWRRSLGDAKAPPLHVTERESGQLHESVA